MNASNASADLVRIQSDRITALEAGIEDLRSRLADAEMILSDAFLEHDETGVCRPCQAEKDAADFLKTSADPVIRAPHWHNPDDLVTIRELRNQCEMWADACAMVEMNRDQLRAERDALAERTSKDGVTIARLKSELKHAHQERDDWRVKAEHGTKREAKLLAERDALRAALTSLRPSAHIECEDSWYSCPMSDEGCADDRQEGCTCGVEHQQRVIDAALAARLED